MKPENKDNSDIFRGFLEHLAMEKKKTVIAICLLAVMAFMWAKILGGKGPNTLKAQTEISESSDQKTTADLKMSYVELPKVKDRNDMLSRDFFNANKEDFRNNKEIKVVSTDGSKAIAKLIAGKLRLDAIDLGANRQAFINDKLLSIGDNLVVLDGTKIYECKIGSIEENTVVVKCEDAEITLKLAQEIEGTD